MERLHSTALYSDTYVVLFIGLEINLRINIDLVSYLEICRLYCLQRIVYGNNHSSNQLEKAPVLGMEWYEKSFHDNYYI